MKPSISRGTIYPAMATTCAGPSATTFAATLADNLNVAGGPRHQPHGHSLHRAPPETAFVQQVCNELAAAYAKIITGMADPGDSAAAASR